MKKSKTIDFNNNGKKDFAESVAGDYASNGKITFNVDLHKHRKHYLYKAFYGNIIIDIHHGTTVNSVGKVTEHKEYIGIEP